jgi:YggT family protein
MFVLGEALHAVAWLVNYLLQAYFWIIVIRALISWVNPDPWNPIVQFLNRITEPVLRPVRRWLPTTGIDISPLIVCLVIEVVRRFVVGVLERAAFQLG